LHGLSARPRRAVARSLAVLAVVLLAGGVRPARSQTPSPLQEWQYSGGLILAQLFEPNPPKWRTVLGLSAQVAPLYDGSKPYRVEGGPVIDVRYYNTAFVSIGEGIGVNILHGDHYRAGVALGYDLGRDVSDYTSHLHGLGDIQPAPFVKVFGEVVLAKKFPLVLRVDARQFVGGADGAVGDVSAYLPLPGSSKRFVMFAGPSITFADRLFLRKVYGVNAAQSLASGYPEFFPQTGESAEGVGFSATWFVTKHVLVNVNAALDRLRGGAEASPITQETTQRLIDLSAAYSWGENF
jgi:outer membrane scaffolding protein for murein synthesis (MipA/OmpV family)